MDKKVKSIAVMVVFLVLIAFSIIFLVQILQIGIITKSYNYVVENIINTTGLSPWLVKGATILLMIPFVFAVLEVTRISLKFGWPGGKKRRPYRKLGLIIIVFYVAGFFVAMYFFSRGTYFNYREGTPTKYYAVTPEGVRYFDSPGYDPKYGIELKPVDPKLINQLERSEKGLKPEKIPISSDLEFFDSITGAPKMWYHLDNEGNIELFNRPGFHPVYLDELKPVNKEIISSIKDELLKKQKLEEEQNRMLNAEEPERITDSENINFFDPVSGKSTVWYYINKNGNYEFFDQPGFHPVYQDELKPVTKDIISRYLDKKNKDEIERQAQEAKRREEEKLEKEAKKEKAQRLLNKALIETNLNNIATNTPERTEVAFLIVDFEENELFTDKIISDLWSKKELENVFITADLFKSHFIEHGNFNSLYGGNLSIIDEFSLIEKVDYLVFGKANPSFSKEKKLKDLISCTLKLELKVFSTKNPTVISGKNFISTGIGLDNDKAVDNAIKKVMNELNAYWIELFTD
jgi:hypothetical protein